MKKNLRIRKLPRPRLQLKLIGIFLGMSMLALLFCYLALGYRLTSLAEELGPQGEVLLSRAQALQNGLFLQAVLIVLPTTVVVGALATSRIAGPIYRFEEFLARVIAGTQRDACRLRGDDELQELCELLNRATEPLRAEEQPARREAA